jgi:hypothetical protein
MLKSLLVAAYFEGWAHNYVHVPDAQNDSKLKLTVIPVY